MKTEKFDIEKYQETLTSLVSRVLAKYPADRQILGHEAGRMVRRNFKQYFSMEDGKLTFQSDAFERDLIHKAKKILDETSSRHA